MDLPFLPLSGWRARQASRRQRHLLPLLALTLLTALPVHAAEERVHHDNAERRGISLMERAERFLLSTQAPHERAITIDARRSVFVTDLAILQHFSFAEVMARLAHESRVAPLGKEKLFRQWWNTANEPVCGEAGLPAKANGFPYACPRDEGLQALTDPFDPAMPGFGYTAIALSNRFDLAELPSKGGTDCGEYRIVFERNSGVVHDAAGNETPSLNRDLIIFEAVLPLPARKVNGQNLDGCRPVQEFWEKLSAIDDVDRRARLLHDFYFKAGTVRGFDAVVRAAHYGNAVPGHHTGQIRTNQFMAPALGLNGPLSAAPPHGPWTLREFHVVNSGGAPLQIVPVPVSTNPPGVLVDETDTTRPVLGPEFRSDFLTQVANLALPKLTQFNMNGIPQQYDSAESIEGALPGGTPPIAMEYDAFFKRSPNFTAAITAKLGSGATLTAQNIMDRALSQTCAGCHHLAPGLDMGGGAGAWPETLPAPVTTPAGVLHGFTQEQLAAPVNGRYQISPALSNVFLPFRACLISDFLAGQPSSGCP